MNDQTARYVKMLKTHLDRITIGVLYALLVALIWFWFSEQDTNSGAQGDTEKTAVLVDKVKDNPEYKKIETLAKPQKIEEYADIEQVRKYNMFDYKSVQDKELLERTARKRLDDAKAAVAKGQKDEAKRLLKEILVGFPTHRGAKDLLAELEGRAPASAATPAPPGATPAAPAAPAAPAPAGAPALPL